MKIDLWMCRMTIQKVARVRQDSRVMERKHVKVLATSGYLLLCDSQ